MTGDLFACLVPPKWWAETPAWSNKPRYEPAPPVDENPWYDLIEPLPEPKSPNEGVFVYLLESGDAYKIGVSTDVAKRMDYLKTGSSRRTSLVALRRGGIKLERRLHAKLKDYRMYGEWFKACPEVYAAFYSEPEFDDTQEAA